MDCAPPGNVASASRLAHVLHRWVRRLQTWARLTKRNDLFVDTCRSRLNNHQSTNNELMRARAMFEFQLWLN